MEDNFLSSACSRELDETLTQQMMEVKFDTEIHTLPKAPDVSSYIVPEVRNRSSIFHRSLYLMVVM